jgi:NADPH-dependent ferric siderophore reductase
VAPTPVQTSAPPVRLFEVEVLAVERLSPNLSRITFSGECLADFDDGGTAGLRDLRVKLLFPSPGQPLPAFGDVASGWYQQWLALDPAVRGSMRTYTARRAYPLGAPPALVIDFVIHVDDSGRQGPGSSFASEARPGDRVAVLGPGAPDGVCGQGLYGGIEWRPPLAAGTELLVVGDETALPAICSILETLGDGYRGHVLVEVPEAGDAVDLPAPAGIQVRWLPRDGGARGARPIDAVEGVMRGRAEVVDVVLPDVDIDREILWDTPEAEPTDTDAAQDPFYAWIAGEASMVRELRRILVRGHGIDRSQVAFMGYWREGRAEN